MVDQDYRNEAPIGKHSQSDPPLSPKRSLRPRGMLIKTTAVSLVIVVAVAAIIVSYVMIAGRDTTPPARVNDLATLRETASIWVLRWIAPGDDSDTGTAAQYDIRYADIDIISDEEFAASTPCLGEPAPAAAGTIQTFDITDLMSETIHYFALKTADEVPNWSPLSISVGIWLEGTDTTPPAAVSDLAPQYPTDSSVELRWTAPGDDGNTGNASWYDIRYASSAIDTEAKFTVATMCVGEPTPAAPGTIQTFNITGLMNDAYHFFAMKTADEMANLAPLSNSIGVPPDFTLNDTSGSPWDLYEHIGNGKPILLEFIHPDCHACADVVPSLVEIYNNYSSELELVSVAVTFDVGGFTNPPNASTVIAFMTQYGAVWAHLVESSGTQVRDMYGIVAVPTFFLTGKDGRIACIHVGGGAIDDLVNAIEQELLP